MTLDKDRFSAAKMAFIFFTALGLLVVLTKTVFTSDFSLFIMSVLTVVVISWYAIYMKRFYEEKVISQSQVGDNCYYMGFIFTLTGLIITLYLSGTERPHALISAFGIGLISTLAGIGWRVYLTQVPPNTEDVVKDNMGTLSESSYQLSRIINDLKDSISDISDDIKKQINSFKEATEDITENMRVGLNNSKQVADDACKALTDSSDKIQNTFNSLYEKLDASSGKIQVWTNNFPSNIENGFSKKIQEICAPIENSCAELSDSLNKIKENLINQFNIPEDSVRNAFSEIINDFKDNLNEKLLSFSTSTEENLNKSVKMLENEFSNINQLLSNFGQSIGDLSNDFNNKFDLPQDSIAEKIQQLMIFIQKRFSDQIPDLVKAINSSFGQHISVLFGGFSQINTHLGETQQKVQKIISLFSDLTDGTQNLKVSVGSLNTTFNDAKFITGNVQGILTSLEKFQGQISELDNQFNKISTEQKNMYNSFKELNDKCLEGLKNTKDNFEYITQNTRSLIEEATKEVKS